MTLKIPDKLMTQDEYLLKILVLLENSHQTDPPTKNDWTTGQNKLTFTGRLQYDQYIKYWKELTTYMCL